MADYKKYIYALRKCAKEHEGERTSTGHIIVSDLCEDTAKLLEWLERDHTPETVTRKVYRDCRDAFIEAVKKVFTDADAFLDYIENVDYSNNYDCFETGTGECYIINRNTGEYINWYKFTHIGRDIHSTVNPDNFEDFLQKFYNSSLQN